VHKLDCCTHTPFQNERTRPWTVNTKALQLWRHLWIEDFFKVRWNKYFFNFAHFFYRKAFISLCAVYWLMITNYTQTHEFNASNFPILRTTSLIVCFVFKIACFFCCQVFYMLLFWGSFVAVLLFASLLFVCSKEEATHVDLNHGRPRQNGNWLTTKTTRKHCLKTWLSQLWAKFSAS
jgi:hypothetical protein